MMDPGPYREIIQLLSPQESPEVHLEYLTSDKQNGLMDGSIN